MRAVLCERFDGTRSLTIGETAEPDPAADEGLDRRPCRVRQLHGLSDDLRRLPDEAGAALRAGNGRRRGGCRLWRKGRALPPGDRVTWENWFGGFAERMSPKPRKPRVFPDNVDFIVGSTLLHTYLTAWYALVDRARLQAGETVLVTGASGGVGLACVELAHLLGGRVIAAVGRSAKASIVREYGAEEVIDYSHEDVRDRVKALTGGRGARCLRRKCRRGAFTTLARLMRWNGRLIPIGFAAARFRRYP